MRKEVKQLLGNKLQTLTGLTPLFNVHKIPRNLERETLFVRLNDISRRVEDNIDVYTFEVYYAKKIAKQKSEIQEDTMNFAEKVIQLHNVDELITDDMGSLHEITFFVVNESYSEDYSDQIGVIAEVRFEIQVFVGNKYSGG